jgi:hypothetical protein
MLPPLLDNKSEIAIECIAPPPGALDRPPTPGVGLLPGTLQICRSKKADVTFV